MKRLDQLEIDFYNCKNIEQARLLMFETELEHVLVSIHDLQGKYVETSSTIVALLGYRHQELTGASAYDYFHPDDFRSILVSHAKVTIRPEVERVEYRLRRADGQYIEVYSLSRQFKGVQDEDQILVITVKRG